MGLFKKDNTSENAASSDVSLKTVLTYLGAGENAIEDLETRLERLAQIDPRINVGEIIKDERGRETCEVKFNCNSYDPPVDGQPDPRAIEDLKKLLGGINPDELITWGMIEYLTYEPEAAGAVC